jgi:hypothetical protein
VSEGHPLQNNRTQAAVHDVSTRTKAMPLIAAAAQLVHIWRHNRL